MKILVANLGSTSFKYRLFDMTAGGSWLVAASNGSALRRAVVSWRSASAGRS
jgi:acetate kinase